MGKGYVLKCRDCDYTCNANDGIGFMYPVVCADILEKMKRGKFGKQFMQDANSSPYAAIHQENRLYICDHCGNLRMDETIDLCVPKENPKERKGRFSTVVDCPKDACYVMTYELQNYKILRSKKHFCGKCRKEMRSVKVNEKLKCPQCNRNLEISEILCWD